jgi:hypothetical protein
LLTGLTGRQLQVLRGRQALGGLEPKLSRIE